jgi:hypothetical protein
MPVDPDEYRRDFYRLVADSWNPPGFCLTMQDERKFRTNIDDLSVSGFGCRIKEANPASQQITHHGLISYAYGKASYHQIRSFSDFSLKRA